MMMSVIRPEPSPALRAVLMLDRLMLGQKVVDIGTNRGPNPLATFYCRFEQDKPPGHVHIGSPSEHTGAIL